MAGPANPGPGASWTRGWADPKGSPFYPDPVPSGRKRPRPGTSGHPVPAGDRCGPHADRLNLQASQLDLHPAKRQSSDMQSTREPTDP